MGSAHEIINNVCWLSYREDTTFENSYDFNRDSLKFIDEQSDLTSVMLDVSSLEMINSSGIGLIVDLYKEVISKNLEFHLVTNDYVYKIMKYVGVDTTIPMIESVQEAKLIINGKN